MKESTAKIAAFVTAAIGTAATCVQLYYSLSHKLADGYSVLYGLNYFFSFFTCLTNTIVAFFLFMFAVAPKSRLSNWFLKPVSNGALALYILIVGMIFYLLLYSTNTAVGIDLAATHVVHGFVPLAYFFLWYFYFRQGTLRYLQCLEWLVFPLIYFLYILGRGELLLVYPYFFLNAGKYGYGPVLLYALAILGFFLVLGNLLVLLDRKRPIIKHLPE